MRLCAALVLAIGIAVQFSSSVTSAHHSFAGEFDNSIAVTVQGVVSGVEMVNPHSFIYLDAEVDGVVQRWALEGPAPNQITRRGLDRELIKVGDALGACGYLARRDVAGTRTEPVTGKVVRKIDAAVLLMPGGEKLLWSNYGQQKCGLDK